MKYIIVSYFSWWNEHNQPLSFSDLVQLKFHVIFHHNVTINSAFWKKRQANNKVFALEYDTGIKQFHYIVFS